ncbi:hypothetical protein [Mesorhizobium sp.]|uniref:hypothetical protein n=1 Tax=Mesorhizobium sp. TaxID=1871066 RepID=UPI000FE9B4D4|nr:hypothetical protein [Mesorhizobium sp.]RWP58615.1 MAG: hypothetical protein EOR08_26595 [Mesorhizobium sp.]
MYINRCALRSGIVADKLRGAVLDTFSIILWGAVGGLIPDVLRLIRSRHGQAPDYFGHWHFWMALVLMVALGALAAWLSAPTKVFDAIAYGIAAPAVFEGLLADKSKEPRLNESSNLIDSWRYWWSV